MTNKEFVEKLWNIRKRKTQYCNKFPRNLCYYDASTGRLSADCWNLLKSLIWDPTIDQNYTNGRYAKPNYSTGMYDWNADGIIKNGCSEVGTTMTEAPIGAFLYYQDGSHAGAYVGKDKNGYMQVIESTVARGNNGVIVSVMAPNGDRMVDGVKVGKWTKWGKLKMIDYIDEPVAPQFAVGSLVMVKQDAKVYGTDKKYKQWVYEKPMWVLKQVGDKVTISVNNEGITGDVSANDCAKYEQPVTDLIKVGDKVKLKTLKNYDGKNLAVWLKGMKLWVIKVNGDKLTLSINNKQITCTVWKDNVEKVNSVV